MSERQARRSRQQDCGEGRELNARWLFDLLSALHYDPAKKARMAANNWYITDRILGKKSASDPPPAHWTLEQVTEFTEIITYLRAPQLQAALEPWYRLNGLEVLTAGELLTAK